MLLFDCETCSRCGGSGHFSYCQRYGTVCFKCGGACYVLTKRGRAAQDFFESLLSKPASQLQAGERIRDLSITAGGDPYSAWFTVREVKPYDNSGNHSYVNGVEIPQRPDMLEIVCDKLSVCNVAPETPYRIAATAEQKNMARWYALGYQDRLTKQGVLRKAAA